MTLVIHHSADADGIASLAMVQRGLHASGNPQPEVIGWDYGDPPPEIDPTVDRIYMVDVTVDALLEDAEIRRKTVLIDHHRTALEKWEGYQSEFYEFFVVEGMAACRLTWAYFNKFARHRMWDYRQMPMPYEPSVIFYIGLRDVWAHRETIYEEQAERLQAWIMGNWPVDLTPLLDGDNAEYLETVIRQGGFMLRYAEATSLELATIGARIREWQGVRFLVLNTAQRGSLALDALSRRMHPVHPHDALMVWCQTSDGTVRVSMYHTPWNTDLDLSQLAKRLGGGGHPGACGFRIPLEKWVHVVG